MLDSLNEQQKKAVEICDKNLLIIAGAGSGKTKTLTYKIAYILKNNIAKPYEILALTFTNKAANEMKERVATILDTNIESFYIGTFHSMSLRFLRKIGKNYTIYDKHDQEMLVKETIISLNLDKTKFDSAKISSYISKLKNSSEIEFPNKEIEKIYKTYEEKLVNNNAVDFDNILINLINEIKFNENIRQSFQNQFKFILIDEYQDTNNTQYQLIKHFYNGNNRVFAVGDEDQSIYAFRGANINNILSFSNDFLPCQVIKLEKNYRSTKNILNIANTIITNNKMRIGKKLYSDIIGVEPIIKEFSTNKDEAYYVVNQIKRILKEDSDQSIAVLYRNNMLSRLFEEYLIQNAIAYKKIGAHKFFDKKEIKDILSFIKLAYNKKDDVSFVRAISNFGGIGEKTIESIKEHSKDLNIDLFESSCSFTQKKYTKVVNFINFVKILQKKIYSDNISECLRFVFDEVFSSRNFYKENLRQANVDELIDFAKNMDIDAFIESASLYDYSQNVGDKENQSTPNVNLLTIHAAKGLEFDHVFMVGLNEGILPSLYLDSVIEEERRIMYVGVTRAKKNLYLSYYTSDFRSTYFPSRFLKEIGSLSKNSLRRYKIGEVINHKDFGNGIILNVKEEPLELKVNFFKFGLKNLTKNDII
ncbi:MAG: ATP-dependent helicase [Desulfurella sp.]